MVGGVAWGLVNVVLSCRCLSLVDDCTQSLTETRRALRVLSPTTLDTPRFLLALNCDIAILSALNISEIELSILSPRPPSPSGPYVFGTYSSFVRPTTSHHRSK